MNYIRKEHVKTMQKNCEATRTRRKLIGFNDSEKNEENELLRKWADFRNKFNDAQRS